MRHLGFKYHLKSRTKSIYSIWRKMKRMRIGFDEVFDLFAIRIIIDCPAGAGEGAVLGDLFDRHRFLYAESRPDAGLDIHPEVERLRIAPYDGRFQ